MGPRGLPGPAGKDGEEGKEGPQGKTRFIHSFLKQTKNLNQKFI